MSCVDKTILVLGYGNPGRLDDGLGPAFAARIEALGFPEVAVDSDYQLNIEDSDQIATYKMVLFADAAVSGTEPYYCKKLAPIPGASFSSHSISAGQVLHLAQEYFQSTVDAYILGMRGYEFNEFNESLSDNAQHNLEAAVSFFQELRESGYAFSNYIETDSQKT